MSKPSSAPTFQPPALTSAPNSQLLYFPSALPYQTPPVSSPTLTPTTPTVPVATSSVPTSGPRLGFSSADSLVLDSTYNLLEDVRQQQTQFAGPKEKISLYQFPSYLATNIRRVLARGRGQRADWCVALSCLVWHGLLRFISLPAAQDLSAGLLALDTDDDLPATAAEQVEQWRRGFRFSIPDPTHTMGLEKSRTWKAPEYVHSELYDTASRLGIAGSTLGTVCIMAALHDQDGVLGDHGRYMRATVAELDQLLAERSRRLQGLIRAIGAGIWR